MEQQEEYNEQRMTILTGSSGLPANETGGRRQYGAEEGIEKREGGVTEALDVRCCSYLQVTSGELG